jgi:2-polyprenyl-3-methyl-5-hydroxy-6-metoxy-1,4-benzoquinol methylase
MNKYFIKQSYRIKENMTPKPAINNGSDYWEEYRIESSKYYQYHVYKYARDLITRNSLKSVADIGCGSGWKLMNLIRPVCEDVLGVDQEAIIKINKEKYGDNYFKSDDFDSLDFKIKRKFNLVVCADVIEHLVDPDKLLNYIKNITDSSSTIIISTPERDIVRGKDNNESPNAEHVREWNKEEFKKYLLSHGFKIIDSKILPAQKFNFSKQFFSYLYYLRGKHRHCMMFVLKNNNI